VTVCFRINVNVFFVVDHRKSSGHPGAP